MLTAPQIEALAMNIPTIWADYGAFTADLASLPPKATRKLVDYAVAFKIPPESPLYMVLSLVDTIEAQIAPAQAPAKS